ncbi:MAG: alpha/beta hydrolase [Tepidisphaeraceae bacterium]
MAAVLKYRLGPRYRHPCMKLDVQRALRWMRFNASGLGGLKEKVAVMGFSAGGHLAATACTQFDTGDASAPDAIDRVSCRPDRSILAYAVLTLQDPFAHAGSRSNLLGKDREMDEALVAEMSAPLRVTEQTPPTFLFSTSGDRAVPVENSLMYMTALRKHGVDAELHLFDDNGRHGVGMATDDDRLRQWWPLAVQWLKRAGW